jgi:hypothetical protein
MESSVVLPRARSAALIVRDLDSETFVYDVTHDEAICLNAVAAAIWRRCDGATEPAAIARDVQELHGVEIDEAVVWFALRELNAKRLLEDPFELLPNVEAELERRNFLRAIGVGAGLLLPIVTSIVVPTPAQAQSCLPTGFVCTANAQCCSGLCIAQLVCA